MTFGNQTSNNRAERLISRGSAQFKILYVVAFLLTYIVSGSAQQSRISPWQIHEGTEGTLRFQGRSDEQRREAFKKAVLPIRDQSGWFPAQTLVDGTVQFDRKSVLKECFEELDFTYFQAIVHVPANVNVSSLIVSLDHGDDAARIYIFNSKYPEGYYDPASDLLSVDDNYKSKDLKSQLVKGEDNRILIVQYDQCPDGNSIKGIRISVNDEEIRPSQIPGTFQLHAYSINGKRVNTGSDYWIGYNPADKSAAISCKIIKPADGNILQFEQVSIDKSKGIIALKVLNANQPDMFLCVMDDKLVKLAKATSGSNRHHFSIRFPEEKEAATLNFVSFESVAFPNWYLRHQGFELKISEAVPNARQDIVYRQDASWLFESLTTQSSITLKGNCLESTQILTTENSLVSNNKMYNLVLQGDGSLCVFKNKTTLIWSSGTQNKGAVKLIMQKDGNLCMYNNKYVYIWGTNTNGNEGSRLVLEDSGELIVYNSSGKAIWQNSDQNSSGAEVAAKNFLELNKSLKLNEQIVSANGEYHFIMQQDGNACIYKNKSTFIWGTMTHGKGGTRASFTKDGNLQILTDKYVLIWGSGQTRTSAVKLVLENTGELVSYDAAGKVVWTSKSSGAASSSASGQITELKGNDNFTTGQKLHSQNGMYYFTLQSDGNLCIFKDQNTLVWSSMTKGSGATSCRIQDGYLQLYNAGGASVWSTGSYWASGSKCSRFTLDDNGYLVFYDVAGKSIGNSAAFSSSFAGGQSFTAESKLTCGNGAYYMALSNGSLCIFNNKNSIVWSSMTNGSGATSCRIQDGYLQLYNAGGASVWSTGSYWASGSKCSRFTLDDNGYLVFYDAGGKSIGNSAAFSSSFAGGQSFTTESKLTCASGAYYMALSNGSLCIFNNKNAIVWSSMTSGSGATSCRIQDGYLQLYNAGGASVWSTGSYWAAGSKCSRFTLDDNGYLVFYDAGGKSIGNSAAFSSSFASGQSFSADSRMTCASGAYYMAISNGSLCIFNNKNVLIWSTMTSSLGGVSCRIQDGYLQLFNAAGNTIWSTQAFWVSGAKCSRFTLDDNGYLVFYDASGKSIGTNAAFMAVMYDLQSLSKGESLVSASGEYHVILQEDGNFCIYKNKTTFVWCSMSNGKGVVKYGFQGGSLCGFNAKGESVWSTSTFMASGSKGVRLVMENSGILTMYDAAGKSVWTHQASAASSGASADKGLVKNGTFDGNPSSSMWTVELAANDQQQGGNSGGCIWLNHNGGANDPSVSQVISGLTIGYWYKVSGEYKGGKNVHLHYKDRTKNAFSVDIDGASILALPLPKELETWTKFEAVFRATKTSCTLRLRGEIDGTDGDVMLDNIKMEETKAPAEVAPVKLPDYFKLHAYSIHGKRVDKGSDYWMGHTGADLIGKIIAPKAGTVFHIEKIVVDAAQGIIALKVINAPESDMYLSVADDKSVKITKVNGGNKHHFIIRSPEEKEAMNLNYVTFESAAFPGWNVRHQGFALKVTQADDNVRKDIVYRQDATWLFEAVVNN